MAESRGMPRVGIFGWGVVAPRSPDVDAFARNLAAGGDWLSPFDECGPSSVRVGEPSFSFETYKPWIDARFPPNRYPTLARKMGTSIQHAIGAFVQSLSQNPGLEEELQRLGARAHVYCGTGMGELPVAADNTRSADRTQRAWDRHWADASRNAARRAYQEAPAQARAADPSIPAEPFDLPHDSEERFAALGAWNAFWSRRSDQLPAYLKELAEAEAVDVDADVETGKLNAIREKKNRRAKVEKAWGAPAAPWEGVDAALLWNIWSGPASQISILGKIRGMTFAPVAACASFGYGLKLGFEAIRSGQAKAVVVGMSEARPNILTVGGLYGARVVSADGQTSKPLTGLRGTHVSGGAAVWVLGDLEHFTKLGMKPLGAELVGVGVSADADHLITPNREGPSLAISEALAQAGIPAEAVSTVDLHATATPGDHAEVATVRANFSPHVLISARKGAFGHGMAVGGGWELTAQFMGEVSGSFAPTTLTPGTLHPALAELHDRYVMDTACPVPEGVAAKLSMGVGGLNSCVLSRPYRAD